MYGKKNYEDPAGVIPSCIESHIPRPDSLFLSSHLHGRITCHCLADPAALFLCPPFAARVRLIGGRLVALQVRSSQKYLSVSAAPSASTCRLRKSNVKELLRARAMIGGIMIFRSKSGYNRCLMTLLRAQFVQECILYAPRVVATCGLGICLR